jgi:hypothetical protein
MIVGMAFLRRTADIESPLNAISTTLLDARPRRGKVFQRGTAHIMWLHASANSSTCVARIHHNDNTVMCSLFVSKPDIKVQS